MAYKLLRIQPVAKSLNFATDLKENSRAVRIYCGGSNYLNGIKIDPWKDE